MTAEPAADLVVRPGRLTVFLSRYVTPEAVYASVLFAAVVAAASDEEPSAVDNTIVINDATLHPSEVVMVLLWAGLSMVVFWAAHVFAHAVAGHGMHDGKPVGVGQATKLAFRHAAGMLYAPVLPSIPLWLGSFGVLGYEDAVDWTLYATMIMLGVLGFLAFTARRANWAARIFGGLGTALLGLVIIVINTLLH
jgi:hypothetical protein